MYTLVMPGSKTNPQVSLRPQDVVVLLRLSLEKGTTLSYAALAEEVQLTASEVHASVHRAQLAQLIVKDDNGRPHVRLEPFKQFLQHGVRYCFPAVRGEITRGLPTSYAAAPLAGKILSGQEPPPVWPDKNGRVRGLTFQPLYPTTPAAAACNPQLYELLAIVDALRSGNPREHAVALVELDARLGP